jgi:ferredoxin
LDVIAFLRRKLAAREAPGTAAEAGTADDPTAPPSSAAGGSKADDALDVIVGRGIEPGGGGPLPADGERLRLLARSYVEAVEGRCVQCGICSYNCPVGIDVRSYSRHALPVLESHCILCGECVARCPRGVLRFHVAGADA